MLAYLSDIFEALDNMNLFFQGPNSFIPDFISKLEAFVRKLDIWMKNVDGRHFGMFKLHPLFQDNLLKNCVKT